MLTSKNDNFEVTFALLNFFTISHFLKFCLKLDQTLKFYYFLEAENVRKKPQDSDPEKPWLKYFAIDQI